MGKLNSEDLIPNMLESPDNRREEKNEKEERRTENDNPLNTHKRSSILVVIPKGFLGILVSIGP